ncbi:helix-turn-helix domain-containing protein [Kitasatospora sp. NPDC058048]|uniref:helix-turn-helix domain-containing protein n=1 Tax=Kitasatospora sp. NPDC058048 TaxID=3346313 RepID=UPI0036D8221D
MPPQGGPELAESGPSQAQGAVRRGTLGALRRAWDRGLSTRAAAARCGVSQSTASRYYRRFKAGRSSSALVSGTPFRSPAA